MVDLRRLTCRGWPKWRNVSARSRVVWGASTVSVVEIRAVGGEVLVFAHGHVLRVLAARWIELAPEAGARLHLSTATISELGFERETAVIRSWNAPAR